MISVYRVLELFKYDTLVKVEPSRYCRSSIVLWGLSSDIMDENEDILSNMEVEVIERGYQAIHIYYNEVK